jgi:hypothetical protein
MAMVVKIYNLCDFINHRGRRLKCYPASPRSRISTLSCRPGIYMSGYSEWEISFLIGIPGYIIREYIDIVKSYENEKSNNVQNRYALGLEDYMNLCQVLISH